MYGRQKTLDAIDEQDNLNALEKEDIDSVGDLTEAVGEISLRQGDRWYRSPPTDAIEAIESVHGQLPKEAREHFVGDDLLRKRINAARRQYNNWLGRLKRSKEIPSVVEAGPAKYPYDKARKKSRLAREASEDLDERIDRVAQAARGGKQRALEAIGSSVAEHNKQQNKSQRERMRDRLEKGDIVAYRSPNAHLGGVVRVNKKSVTLRRPNPRAGQTKPLSDEPEPDYLEGRVGLDSDFLDRIPPNRIDNPTEATDINISPLDDLPSEFEAAQEYLLGES